MCLDLETGFCLPIVKFGMRRFSVILLILLAMFSYVKKQEYSLILCSKESDDLPI